MAPLYLSVLVFLAACLLRPSNAFRPRPRTTGTAPRCSSVSKPCRVKAELHYRPGSSSSIVTAGCSCPEAVGCTDDWGATDADRIIIREMFTYGNQQLTLRMKFCGAVTAKRDCVAPRADQSPEVALVLSGQFHVPTEVEQNNCACPDNRPLVPVREQHRMGNGRTSLYSFACATHKPVCSATASCLVLNSGNDVSFPCRCRPGRQCSSSRGGPPYTFRCRAPYAGYN